MHWRALQQRVDRAMLALQAEDAIAEQQNERCAAVQRHHRVRGEEKVPHAVQRPKRFEIVREPREDPRHREEGLHT